MKELISEIVTLLIGENKSIKAYFACEIKSETCGYSFIQNITLFY